MYRAYQNTGYLSRDKMKKNNKLLKKGYSQSKRLLRKREENGDHIYTGIRIFGNEDITDREYAEIRI